MADNSPVKSEPGHFAYFDVIRGIAFLNVLAMHAASVVGYFAGKDILSQARFGVKAFFLTSAATLCLSAVARRKVDRHPVASFFIRRIFRIAPMFWLAIVFYQLLPDVMPAYWLGQWAPDGVGISQLLLTDFFLHGWQPYAFNSVVPGGWSLAVEMSFYMCFPVLFYYLGNSPRHTLFAILASLLFIHLLWHFDQEFHEKWYPNVTHGQVWGFFSGSWFPVQLPVFLFGFLIFHLLRNPVVTKWAQNRVIAGTVLCVAIALLMAYFKGGFNYLIRPYYVVVVFLCVVILAVSGGMLPGLVNVVFGRLGKISYSCYLTHFAALGIGLKCLGLHPAAAAPVCDPGSAWHNFILFLKLIAITLPLTVAISSVTYHAIEVPGVALGKKLIAKLNRLPSLKPCLQP